MTKLFIKSPVFDNDRFIPPKYTCDGENVNPPLVIEGIPQGTKSLVLIVEDPDVLMGIWIHWIVWNISPKNKIKEKSVPGVEGLNDFGRHSYRGPCPPTGVHRFFFKVYALDIKLFLDPNASKKDLERAMKGHILANGEIIGRYGRG